MLLRRRQAARLNSIPGMAAGVAAASGLGSPLPHVNRSGSGEGAPRSRHRRLRWQLRRSRFETRNSWRDYHTAETVSAIARLYADDVERFGYSF